MERATSDKTQHQAAFSPWIVRIIFQRFSMLDDRGFELGEGQSGTNSFHNYQITTINHAPWAMDVRSNR
jgi:hypothetical protein